MKSFKEFYLLNEVQRYKGEVTYQKDDKFRLISINNIYDMLVLHEDNDFYYLVNKQKTSGFVFDKDDFKTSKNLRPVMSLNLRQVFNNLQQVHRLRIRESYARVNVTTEWYRAFIKEFGAIVSDTEHLEGGYKLWRSFINSDEFKVSLYDTNQNKIVIDNIPSDIEDEVIWSWDESKRNLVMILTSKL